MDIGGNRDDFKTFLLEDSPNSHQNRQKQPKLSQVNVTNSQNEERKGPRIRRTTGQIRPSLVRPILMTIPEEQHNYQASQPAEDDFDFSQGRSLSNTFHDNSSSRVQLPALKPQISGGQFLNHLSSYNSDNRYNAPPSYYSGGHNESVYYKMLDDQTEEDLQVFTRKLFAFFSLEKMTVSVFLTYVYNYDDLKVYILNNFMIFAIAAFSMIAVLMMVHVAIDYAKKSPFNYLLYLIFMVSECWILAFIMVATTSPQTILLLGISMAAVVLAVSIFLNSQGLIWPRGVLYIVGILALDFLIITTIVDSVDIVTLITCMTGGLFFGIFVLYKAFQLLSNRYPHTLSKYDYIIGSITIYVDFGFVLLIMLFIMLAMIRNFVY